jgi:hypothetical protein
MKKLADEAGVKYSLWLGSKPAAYMTYDELEKFAELIVKECAEVLDETISPPSNPMNSIGYRLKEHFGVES